MKKENYKLKIRFTWIKDIDWATEIKVTEEGLSNLTKETLWQLFNDAKYNFSKYDTTKRTNKTKC